MNNSGSLNVSDGSDDSNLSIFKNSYVMCITSFFVLYVLFYLFGIGYVTDTVNGKQVRRMSFKYPLAFSLIIWLIWHFYLFPPKEVLKPNKTSSTAYKQPINQLGGMGNELDDFGINIDLPFGDNASPVPDVSNQTVTLHDQQIIVQPWI